MQHVSYHIRDDHDFYVYFCKRVSGILFNYPTAGVCFVFFISFRLNFDYDIRRGTEDGPWVDGIPFDGRDIWQFTLVADDSMENLWRADPSSFVSLGPMHRPRCWPWSNDNDLPYERCVLHAMLNHHILILVRASLAYSCVAYASIAPKLL